jgi:hypothetical protein
MPTSPGNVLRPYDRDALRARFRAAQPFPHVVIDDFLDPGFARAVADSYPRFEQAAKDGRVFASVNEKLKLQLTDADSFPTDVRRLSDAINSPAFLGDLAHVTGIPHLLADERFDGGGMHMTGPGGRLDVHVDFNVLADRGWHRRLNILIYLNPEWRPGWGGELELWDRDVRQCCHSIPPLLNRCVIFETSEISYHGVVPISAPPGVVRKSFAAYYYTEAAPANWNGKVHSTVFRARPNEPLKGRLLMPLERLGRRMRAWTDRVKLAVRRVLGDQGKE